MKIQDPKFIYRDGKLYLLQNQDSAIEVANQDEVLKWLLNIYEPENCKLTWCIDRDKSKECFNQCTKYKSIEVNTIYELTGNYEVEIEEIIKDSTPGFPARFTTKKIATIKSKTVYTSAVQEGGPRKPISPPSSLPPSQEDNREEDAIWEELMQEWYDAGLNIQSDHILPYLKSKFYLSRKVSTTK